MPRSSSSSGRGAGDPAGPSSPSSPGGHHRPSPSDPIRITSATTIAVQAAVGVVVGLAVFRFVEATTSAPPSFPLTMPVLLGFTAAAVIVLARHTWRRVHRDGAWVEAARGIRLLALGKASVAVGAGLGGLQLGVIVLLLGRLQVAVNVERAVVAGVGVLICAVLVAAGLALQRACRIPDDDTDGRDRPAR